MSPCYFYNCISHAHAFSRTRTLHSLYSYILIVFGPFLCFSLPLSLLFTLVASWHLNVNLLHLGTFFVLRHPLLLTSLPLTSGSVIKRPNQTSLRTSLDEAFIWNAKSFCRTSPTLTYPLSFTVGVGSHYVTSRSLVHPC